MCGIAGFIDLRSSTSTEDLHALVQRMTDTLEHRGPDSQGIWVDPAVGVAMGHRRLAILDLSPTGHQPMVSASGRFVIVYNGELYNFRELRLELDLAIDDSVNFRGQSDTEVMLACFDRWGVKSSLPRFNGMFAFAVWDRDEYVVHLGRDRMGEKPLYYGWAGKIFLFGSELKALCAHPEFRRDINRDALMLYMRHNCVPAPTSIYQGIYKLPPASLLSLATRTSTSEVVPYWSLKDASLYGRSNPFLGTIDEALAQLEDLLRDAIKIRTVADVPLGAFLSGGVDSSIITALMQTQSSRPVKTFTIGSHDSAYDEAQSAAAVAHHLGTDHTELYVTAAEALSVIPKLPTIYDEPFADSSQIPTFLVSQVARQQVTVGLTGDGGDELFGGYNRHVWSSRIWSAFGWLPTFGRNSLAKGLRGISARSWDRLFANSGRLAPGLAGHRNPGLKLHKIADLLAVDDRAALYLRHVSHWCDPGEVVIGGSETEYLSRLQDLQRQFPGFVEQLMFLDSMGYLPDDILTKLDRASMAVGLEGRVPFLDHRIVEFACSLPIRFKIREGQGKWLLRQLLYRHVPRKLVDRPKMGFGIPIDVWLRGPLREWAEALLSESRLKSEGFFNPAPIREIWKDHLSGVGSWQYHLWDVLMFQAWLEANRQLPAGKNPCGLPSSIEVNDRNESWNHLAEPQRVAIQSA